MGLATFWVVLEIIGIEGGPEQDRSMTMIPILDAGLEIQLFSECLKGRIIPGCHKVEL